MQTLDMPHVSRYRAGHGRPDARRLKTIEGEKVFFQGLYEHFGERRDTVLVSFAATHREDFHLQAHVLKPGVGGTP